MPVCLLSVRLSVCPFVRPSICHWIHLLMHCSSIESPHKLIFMPLQLAIISGRLPHIWRFIIAEKLPQTDSQQEALLVTLLARPVGNGQPSPQIKTLLYHAHCCGVGSSVSLGDANIYLCPIMLDLLLLFTLLNEYAKYIKC